MTPGMPFASLLTFGLLAFPQSPTIDPPAVSNPYARVAWLTLNQGVDDKDTNYRKQAIEAAGTGWGGAGGVEAGRQGSSRQRSPQPSGGCGHAWANGIPGCGPLSQERSGG